MIPLFLFAFYFRSMEIKQKNTVQDFLLFLHLCLSDVENVFTLWILAPFLGHLVYPPQNGTGLS